MGGVEAVDLWVAALFDEEDRSDVDRLAIGTSAIGRPRTASAIPLKRSVKSAPRRLRSVTRSPCFKAIRSNRGIGP
jgi:hypothetical protein